MRPWQKPECDERNVLQQFQPTKSIYPVTTVGAEQRNWDQSNITIPRVSTKHNAKKCTQTLENGSTMKIIVTHVGLMCQICTQVKNSHIHMLAMYKGQHATTSVMVQQKQA